LNLVSRAAILNLVSRAAILNLVFKGMQPSWIWFQAWQPLPLYEISFESPRSQQNVLPLRRYFCAKIQLLSLTLSLCRGIFNFLFILITRNFTHNVDKWPLITLKITKPPSKLFSSMFFLQNPQPPYFRPESPLIYLRMQKKSPNSLQ
jgi:hypothetical protein